MSDYTTTTDSSNAIADELYRIHCYADTLAKLCATGNSVTINPEQLEQIFSDIAAVTDKGSSTIHTTIDNLKSLNKSAQKDFKDDATLLKPPYIKSRKIMGKTERIYVPEYVEVEGRSTTEILKQGVIIPENYEHYKVDDFVLKLSTKDSFKEVYLLTPKWEPRLLNESCDKYEKRTGVKIIRNCKQV
jgi:hypothetical protein